MVVVFVLVVVLRPFWADNTRTGTPHSRTPSPLVPVVFVVHGMLVVVGVLLVGVIVGNVLVGEVAVAVRMVRAVCKAVFV